MGAEEAALRVVLDTNTVVSALLFSSGRLAWLRSAWRALFTPLASRRTLDELVRVLAYPKFGLDKEDIELLLTEYLPFTEIVEEGRASRALPRCSDPADQMFVELAAAGDADVLVTGDAALLKLSDRVPFSVETPAKFAVRFNA